MFISRISVIVLSITASEVLAAQAPEIKQLEISINRPLLILPEFGTDLRYFIERRGKATYYWIANRGRKAIHFTPVWIMQGDGQKGERDGKPQPTAEGSPHSLPPRIHISPYGRMHIIPPEGFKELLLTEIRIGEDTGPFTDAKEAAGRGGLQ